jgi:lipopolysaccharide transport system permease protein
VFAYCALVPWTYFAGTLAHASSSLVDQSRLITKVYFPRVLLPAASVTGGLLDLAVSLVVLLGMLAFYGIPLRSVAVALPLFVALAAGCSFGAALWLSSLSVQYRDVKYIVPFLVQIWLFATPVAYSSSLIPDRWRALYGLNPMSAVVDGFRWSLLGAPAPARGALLVSAASVGLVVVAGLFHFRRMERRFADVV